MRILFCNYEYPPLGGGGGVFNKQIADKMLAHKISAEEDKSRAATDPKGFKFAWNGKLMKGSISATYISFGVSDTYVWTPDLNDL